MNFAWNGSPEGFPRGVACTLRDDMPWPKAFTAGMASSPIQARRVSSHFTIAFQYNDEMAFDFSGKTAVVTGGANGIGAATAWRLALGGARVVIFDLEREHPAAAAREAGRYGVCRRRHGPRFARARLRAGWSARYFDRQCGHRHGNGIQRYYGGDWQRTIAVNLTGVFHTLQAAAVA